MQNVSLIPISLFFKNSESQQFWKIWTQHVPELFPVKLSGINAPKSKIAKMKNLVTHWREKFAFRRLSCHKLSAVIGDSRFPCHLFDWQIFYLNLRHFSAGVRSVMKKKLLRQTIFRYQKQPSETRPARRKEKKKCANNRRMNLPLLKYNSLSLDQCSLWSGVIWICFRQQSIRSPADSRTREIYFVSFDFCVLFARLLIIN